jgi:hypothetical protein
MNEQTNIVPAEKHPVFSFADAEIGPLSNKIIRSLERATGQPKLAAYILTMSAKTCIRHIFGLMHLTGLALASTSSANKMPRSLKLAALLRYQTTLMASLTALFCAL